MKSLNTHLVLCVAPGSMRRRVLGSLPGPFSARPVLGRRLVELKPAAPLQLEEGGLPVPPKGWFLEPDLGAGRALLKREVFDEVAAWKQLPDSLPAVDDADKLMSRWDETKKCPAPVMDVVVQLIASNRAAHSETKSGEAKSLRGAGRRHVLPAADNLPDVATQFSVLVVPRDGRKCVLMAATSVGDGVAIDSLILLKDPSIVAMNSEAAWSLSYTYQGPMLNQRMFAEALMNCNTFMNPTSPTRQFREHPFHPAFDPCNFFTRFGHYAAHTVNPKLYEAIKRYAVCVGIDDDFGSYMKSLHEAVRKRETAHWKASVMEFVARGRRRTP